MLLRPQTRPLCGVPTGGSDREPCGKLRPLSVDRDASHDRGPTVPQRRILLDVKQYFERVSHSLPNLF